MKRPQFSLIRDYFRQPKSLRTLFVGLFVLQSFIFFGLTYLLFEQGKQEATTNLLTVLTTETSERIGTQISQELNTAIRLNAINRDVAIITNGTTNYNSLIRTAIIQLHNFPNISAIGISQVGGYSLRVNRYRAVTNQYDVELIRPDSPNELQIFRVNTAAQKIADLETVSPFKPSDWPWYKSIQDVKPNSWSRPHITRDGSNLVISTYSAKYATDTKTPPTLFVSSISLREINQLLEAQQFQINSLALVTELDGKLIGSTTSDQPYLLTRTNNAGQYTLRRTHIQDNQNPVLASLAPLISQARTLKPGESRLQTLKIQGRRYYVEIERLDFDRSLDWLLITVVPELELTQAIQKNLMPTLVLLAVLFGLIVTLNLLTAQAIIRPIRKLQNRTREFAKTQLSPTPTLHPIKEISQLDTAFVEMSATILEILQQLQRLNLELGEQRAHLAQILDALPVGIGIHEPDGKLSYMNPAGLKFLGLEKIPDFHSISDLNQDFNLYQAGTDELYPPEKLPAALALQGQTTELDDIEVRNGDVKRTFAVRSTPLYAPDGTIEAALVAFLDISDRKQVEQILENYNATLSQDVANRTAALQKSEERFRFALQSTDTSWWDWDVKTNEVDWSENFDQMVGRAPNSYPKNATSFLSFLHPDDVEPTRTKLYDSVENDTPYKTEFRFVHPDGSIRWIMATGTVQRDETGQAVRMSGINLDITERKQAEEALKKSEERLKLAVSSKTTNWWNWDIINDVVNTSTEFNNLVNFSLDQAPKKLEDSINLAHPDDRNKLREAIRASVEDDQSYEVEYRIIKGDGEVIWASELGAVQRDEFGRPIQMSGITIDITERKQIEEALQKSEESLKLALSAETANWWKWDIVNDQMYSAPSFHNLLGRHGEELPKTWADAISMIYPEDQAKVQAAIEATLEHDAPFKVEFRMVPPNGKMVWIADLGALQRDENGRPIQVSGIMIDITERKQIEEALRISEERLRLSLSSTDTSWWDWDIVHNSVQWSDNFYAMVGRTPEDCPPNIEGFISFLHPDDRERVGHVVQASLEEDAPYRVEFRLLHPDGTIFWVMAKGIVQRDETGRPIRMSGINLDINERKQVEEALRTSEERLRMALESTSTYWWERDLITGQSNWSDEWETALGYAKNSLPRHKDTFFKLLHPEDRERVNCQVAAAIETGMPYQIEFRLQGANGQTLWMLETCSVEYDKTGQAIRLRGLNINITALKEVQLALAEREQLLQALFDQASQFSALLTPAGQVVQINQRALDFAGVTAANVLQQNFWETPWWQGATTIQEELKTAIHRASQGEIVRYDAENQGRAGQQIILDFTIRPIYDDHQALRYLLCEGRDITDKFLMQQALQESEERFRQSFNTTAVSSALVGLDGRLIEVNPAICEFFGYTEDELKTLTMESLSDPAAAPLPNTLGQQLLDQVITSYSLEKRYRHRQGHWIWGLLTVSLVRDEQKHPLYYIYQIQNIDPLKQAQEELQQVNTELERLTQVDSLTGVYNRRYFDQVLEQEWQIAGREGQFLALLMLDIDYFKDYNDTLGHQAGDQALISVAHVLKQAIHRTADFVARYGGEEFVLILPRTDLPGAIVIAERIQDLLSTQKLSHPTSAISDQLTLSIGIHCSIPRPNHLPRTGLKAADDALYLAKQTGRNRYVVSEMEL